MVGLALILVKDIHLTTQDILPTSEFVWSGLNLLVLQLCLELSTKQNEEQGR